MALNSDNPKPINPSEGLLGQLANAQQMNQGYATNEYQTRWLQNSVRNPKKIPTGEVVDSFIGNIIARGEYNPLAGGMYYVLRQVPYPCITFVITTSAGVSTEYSFQRTNATFTALPDTTGTLAHSGGTWTLTAGGDTATYVGANPSSDASSWSISPDTLTAVSGDISVTDDASLDKGFAATPYIVKNISGDESPTGQLLPQDGSVFVQVTGVRCTDGTGMILYYFNQPSTTGFWAQITSVSGSFPQWTYTVKPVQKYSTANPNTESTLGTTSMTAYNSLEWPAPEAGYAYVYGNGIYVADSSGHVNASYSSSVSALACEIRPAPVGATVWCSYLPDSSTGSDLVFSYTNSAQ